LRGEGVFDVTSNALYVFARGRVEMVASFQRRNMGLEAFAVGAIHFHGLLQCRDHYPTWWIGVAKKESSHYCKQTGHAPVGGFWATGTKSLPIE